MTVEDTRSREARASRQATGQTRDLIVIGASAGGVEALSELIQRLPANLPAAVFVVLHLSPQSVSRLPEILNFQGSLRATHPRDGEAIQSGHVYVAPPDRHLLLDTGCVRVVRGPKENGFRPAVDPLFRSAALAYGPRVIGVVLTGALDDGAAGLWAVKRWGGMAVVQDPREAKFASMPANALEYVQVDYCLPIAEVGSLLSRAAGEPAPEMDLNESATRRTEAAAYLALMTNGVSSARGKETVNNETVDNEITEKRRMKTTVGMAARYPDTSARNVTGRFGRSTRANCSASAVASAMRSVATLCSPCNRRRSTNPSGRPTRHFVKARSWRNDSPLSHVAAVRKC
jgi:hypothetical protein